MLMRYDMHRFAPSKAIPFMIGVEHVPFLSNYARFRTLNSFTWSQKDFLNNLFSYDARWLKGDLATILYSYQQLFNGKT